MKTSLSWFRMYSEARNDRKLAALADDEHRVWFNLLCYSSEREPRGVFPIDDPTLLALEVANNDEALLERTLAKLERMVVTGRDTDFGWFLHFSDRQYDNPSDRPESTRERKRKQREREKEDGVTTCHEPSRLEESRGEEMREDLNGVQPVDNRVRA